MNLKTIADYLTTALTGTNTFVVTDNVQYYNEDLTVNDEKYIPALITLVAPFREETGFRETFTFNLHFKVDNRYIDDFYTDIQSFIDSETPVTEGSFQVVKTYQSVRYTGKDGNGTIDYYEFDLEFTWVYNLSVVGKLSTITVDGNALLFTSCRIDHDTAYVSNITSTTDNYRLTNDLITLEVPLILSNTAIATLYADMNSNYYNKTYTLVINGISKAVALKKNMMQINNTSETVGLTVILETAYPRVALTLDGANIPNTAYHFNSKRVSEPAGRIDDNQKAYITSIVKSWSITFVKDDSAIYTKVENDAYGNDGDITYTLIRDGRTFTVYIADVVESHTETGDMSLQCQFMEYGG